VSDCQKTLQCVGLCRQKDNPNPSLPTITLSQEPSPGHHMLYFTVVLFLFAFYSTIVFHLHADYRVKAHGVATNGSVPYSAERPPLRASESSFHRSPSPLSLSLPQSINAFLHQSTSMRCHMQIALKTFSSCHGHASITMRWRNLTGSSYRTRTRVIKRCYRYLHYPAIHIYLLFAYW